MINSSNPLGLAGIEFIEFSTPDVNYMHDVFIKFGFSKLNQFKNKNITHYKQNDINFLLNSQRSGLSWEFSKIHGPSICSMGWRVSNAEYALNEAVQHGAMPATDSNKDLPYPAIYGIGGSLIYFIDQFGENGSIYDTDFITLDEPQFISDRGFIRIDHLTNNVIKGTMETWVKFYKEIFGFTEAHFFDVRGEKTGLTSYALRSPDGSFSIPINEGDESASQIEEYLREYAGPGIQHVAFLTEDILLSLDSLEETDIETLDIHESYYHKTFERFPPNSSIYKERIIHHQVLIDGNEDGILLQIFTKNIFGPIFFEFIQRDGCLGFGEGNFQALFESIERDQKLRQVI
ncbi:MAG: 4-hydroxyphenylpyruvate dioxygenase [Methylococcales bacterium]